VQRGDSWAQTAHAQNYARGTSTAGFRTDSGAAAASRVGTSGTRTTVGRTQSGDIYAGRDGNVYRRNEGGGWQQSNGSGGWNNVDTTATRDRAAQAGSTATNRQLDSDRAARASGNQSTTNRSGWESSGRTRSGASSYGGGRMRGGGGGRRR
jgi:hypothetical protein